MKKDLLLFIFLLFTSKALLAQTDIGDPSSPIFLNGSFVGVGTTSIGEKLNVAGNIQFGIGNSIGIAISNDKFVYSGVNVGHYSLGWYYVNGGAPKSIYSAYGGIRLMTGGFNRLAIAENGSIGIGTDTPDPNAGMHLYQNRYTLYGPNTTWGAYLQVGGEAAPSANASVFATNGNLHLDAASGYHTYINWYNKGNTFINPQGGVVGIGTVAPQAKLHVIHTPQDANGNSFIIGPANGGNLRLGYNVEYTWMQSHGGKPLHINEIGNNTILNLTSGKVGIGTSNLSEGFKLFVKEGIRTEKVKVDMESGWADYVFEPSYKLPSLKQVELFILDNKHLPGVPSAKEVERDGIDLGKMDATLLRKIEELTLYLIEIKKENELLNQANKALQNRIQLLEKK